MEKKEEAIYLTLDMWRVCRRELSRVSNALRGKSDLLLDLTVRGFVCFSQKLGIQWRLSAQTSLQMSLGEGR